MPDTHTVTFHMPGRARPVTPGSQLWNLPLPGTELPSAQTPPKAGSPSLGDYFTAAADFLFRDKGQMLSRAVTRLTGQAHPVQQVRISLEKHGAFYHPLKITVETQSGGNSTLVLNGAVASPGRSLVETEYRLLGGLADRVTPSHIPRVFGAGKDPSGRMGFFLGEWFDGYCEFHATGDGRRVVIWTGTENRVLDFQAVSPVYERIAFVLTAYFDPDTGAEIFPWHHAAGDFIVNPEDPSFPVRLVTVRGYGPVSEMGDGDPEGPNGPNRSIRLLTGLLFFFLNLTLRIRLDRLDGTGKPVFLPGIVLRAAVAGFFHGLAEKTDAPADLADAFVAFASDLEPDQLTGILINLLESWHPNASEREILGENLVSHCAQVHEILKNR